MDVLSSQGDGWAQGALVLREKPLENLKRLVLPGMRFGYKTEAIDWVVEQCPALEAFDVPCFADASVGDAVSSLLQKRTNYLTLEDATDSEWACRNLENLHVAIDMGRHESPHLCSSSPSSSSSHVRKPPGGLMTPTLDEESDADELIYRENLRTLYRTIAAAKNSTTPPPPSQACSPSETAHTINQVSSPLLSNLTRLRELRGAVHADIPESMVTMDQNEVEWMVEHWPPLGLVEFLPTGQENKVVSSRKEEMILSHLKWLKKHRPKEKHPRTNKHQL
ncbi:hypothetical protein EC957_004499 [Mortierella hygrophila]|uniref:Uncharacterized protein n=1 Tax=Mortierella hygrophila TaxID=979708 RepID=A0A9P6FEW4_9FUNG|nr:hypothetical protein EC957_004499 [Mortierella hygrophila]